VDAIAANVKQALVETLAELQKKSLEDLLTDRYKRLQAYGQYTER